MQTPLSSWALAILVGIVNLVFTVLAMALIDKLGLKNYLQSAMSGVGED